MRRADNGMGYMLLIGFVLGCCTVKAAEAIDVEAQDLVMPRYPLTSELSLARVCAKEEGLMPGRGQTVEQHDASLRDGCVGIDQVLERGASRSGVSFTHFAMRYSPAAFSPGALNPWVAHLVWGEHMPAGWPDEHVSWMPTRPRRRSGLTEWRKLMTLSLRIRRGEERSACPEPPDHWGSPLLDHARREADGWISERCGAALNEFWIVPARHLGREVRP